ncbi:MAG: heat shock protein HspQ [Pseudomonadota bacterium]
MKQAKFNIGQIVYHKRFDYRGVIYDVDPIFCGSEEWYEVVAKSRPPKDKPWYKVLVDNAKHETYVAEQNLENTNDKLPLRHPLIERYFTDFHDGRYWQEIINN